MRLYRFTEPALKSCATCTHWTLANGRPWCPRAAKWLPSRKMQLVGCMFWEKELYESDAVELYERLCNGQDTK